MKKDTIINFVLAISILLSGCSSAQVENIPKPEEAIIAPLGFAATIQGIRSALQAQAGTFILESENAILFAWPSGYNYGFAGFSKDGKAVGDIFRTLCGQKCDIKSMSDLYNSAIRSGWKDITPCQVGVAILNTLQMYALNAEAFVSKALPTIPVIILPAVLPGQIAPIFNGAPMTDS